MTFSFPAEILRNGSVAYLCTSLGVNVWATWRQIRHMSSSSRNIPSELEEFRQYYYTLPQQERCKTAVTKQLWSWIIMKIIHVSVWILLVRHDWIPFLAERASQFHYLPFLSKEVEDDVIFGFMFSLLFSLFGDYPEELIHLSVPYRVERITKSMILFVKDGLFKVLMRSFFGAVGYLLLSLLIRVDFGLSTAFSRSIAITFVAVFINLSASAICDLVENAESDEMIQIPVTLQFFQRARRICEMTGYPLDCVMIKKADKLTGWKWSAYSVTELFGTWKRIVFTSSMIRGFPDPDQDPSERDKGLDEDALEGALAHEIGHWALNHHAKETTVAGISYALVFFLALWMVLEGELLYEAFHFAPGQRPLMAGLILAHWVVLKVVHEMGDVISFAVSRKCESDADRYATRVLRGNSSNLAKCLVQVTVQVVAYPSVDEWYEILFLNHPSLVTRLRVIEMEAQRFR